MAERFYYCLRHHAVETEVGCTASQRLGPYPTNDAAERALETVAERNAAWDNDPRWNDIDG